MNFAAATQSALGQILATMGEPVTYTPIVGSPYPLNGVFDEAYEAIDPNTQTLISTTHPVMLVRLSDMALPPAKGDQFTLLRTVHRNFQVMQSKPDGRGGALLILHKA